MWNWIVIIALSLLQPGYGFAQSKRVESEASCALGKAALLGLMTSHPTPPYALLQDGSGYFLIGNLFAEVLGSSPKSIIINESEELRYVSASLYRSSVLIVLGQAPRFDERKLLKVLPVVKLQEIKVSLLWTSSAAPQPELVELVKASGGSLWTLSDLREKLDAYVCPAP